MRKVFALLLCSMLLGCGGGGSKPSPPPITPPVTPPVTPPPVTPPPPAPAPADCTASTVSQLQACVGNDRVVEIVAPIEFGASQRVVLKNLRNLTIRGASANMTISESPSRFEQGTMGEFFLVEDSAKVSFKSLRFVSAPSTDTRCAYPGDRYNTPACYMFIMIRTSEDTLIESVEFDAERTFLVGVMSSVGTTVRNSRFLSASTFGIWSDSIPELGPTENTLVETSYFRDVGANAILAAGSVDMVVRKNTFENNHRLQQYLVNGHPTGGGQVVVERSTRGVASRNIVYSDNIFKNNRRDSSVTGLEIAPFYESDLDGLYVTGNTFQGHTGDALTIGDTEGLNRIKDLVITGNTLTDNYRGYVSQLITKAIESMTLGDNATTSSAGNIKASLSAPNCAQPDTGCSVRLAWTVSASSPVKIFQRGLGRHPSQSPRQSITQTSTSGSAMVVIPAGGAVFELYSAADYDRPDGYGWEAPAASITVR